MCIFSFNIIPKGNAKNSIWASFFLRDTQNCGVPCGFPLKGHKFGHARIQSGEEQRGLAWIPAPNHVAHQSWKSCFELFRDPWPLLEVFGFGGSTRATKRGDGANWAKWSGNRMLTPDR